MGHLHYILNEHNEPVVIDDMMAWAAWCFENITNRTVGYTQINSAIEVSTVFLGIDHNYWDGEPILFETAVFTSEEDTEIMARYHTWDEAVAGHDEVVREQRLKAGQRVGVDERADRKAEC